MTVAGGGTQARRRRVWIAAAAVVVVLVVAVLLARPWEPLPEPAVAAPPDGWVQLFGDEFSAPALDTAVWQPDRTGALAGIPFNPAIEDAWFDPANAAVDDGVLALRLEEDRRRLAGRTYTYSSGMVQSNSAVDLRPDRYVEARIRFPRCDGCWPAFWLHPLDRWPPEIDVAEFLESGSESRPHFNYIRPSEEKTGPDVYGDSDVDHRDEFHTYGVLWESSRVVPYLDGRAYEELAVTRDVTDLPMMIILNLSIRGGYEPVPGARMLVDWVRVWEPAASAG